MHELILNHQHAKSLVEINIHQFLLKLIAIKSGHTIIRIPHHSKDLHLSGIPLTKSAALSLAYWNTLATAAKIKPSRIIAVGLLGSKLIETFSTFRTTS